MSRKNTLRSNIMQAVHETASDFHRLGFIDRPKMRVFDFLCLAPSQAKSSCLTHDIMNVRTEIWDGDESND